MITILNGSRVAEMKEYLELCLEGEKSIPTRKIILQNKREALLQSIEKLQQAVAFIDWKQSFYDKVLSGEMMYYSNLLPELRE